MGRLSRKGSEETPIQNVPSQELQSIAPVAPMYPSAVRTFEGSNANPRKRSASCLDNDEQNSESTPDCVRPHRPDTEAEPKQPIFHPAARDAETKAIKAIEKLLNFIESADIKDERLPALAAMVRRAQRPNYNCAAVSVMLTGATGTGKSYSLNNILGQKDISTQSGNVSGCTNVVTQYSYGRNSGRSPYEARVVISSVTEAIELVNNSITDVIELNRYLTQKEHDLMTDADEEAMEESRLVRRADSALDVLNALFWNHPYFRDIEDVRQYLGEIDSLDDPKAATCRDWICDIISELDDVKITTHSAADVNILKNRLEPFITRTSDLTVPGTRLKCHAWPIVSAIQISLNARALKPGVKIFDIPGVGDTNTAHVDKARASLYGADIIIVTTRVSRVAANDNVYNQIVWALQRRGPRHVIALCTHSDEGLNNDTGIVFTSKESNRIKQLDDDIAKCDAQEKQCMSALTEVSNGIQRIQALLRDSQKYKKQKKLLENERFEIRVEARNRKASQDLKDKFKRHPKGPLLNVFCVRNEEYDKHLTGYNVSDPPRLTLEATGIPALTRFIMSLPGTGRWNVLDAHIRKDMYITFQTLELYGNSAPSQYKGEVAEICADFSKSAPDKARKFYKTFQQKQMSIVKQELAKGLDSWVLKAGNICDNWKSNINSRSYGVIIKKNGVHNSRKAGDINWNNDLLGPVRPYIDQILNKLQSEIARTLPVEIGKILSGLIENLEQKLLNDPAASIAGVKEEFIASLPLRGEEMERKCHEACEKLAKKLRTVHDDAVTLGDKSYFPPTMAGAYDAAKQAKQSGRTSIHAARCAAFKEAVQSRNGPFYALKKRLERECNKVLEEGHIDILHSVHEIFKAIEFDANNACPDGSPDMDPKAQEFNNNLLSLVAETKKEVKNEIIPCLGEAIHYGLESQNN